MTSCKSRTTDAQWSLFSLKYQTFGLGQTIWADKFWGICGTFCLFISTHFGTASPLPMFSINHWLFLQKKPLYPNPKYLFGIGIWIWIWAAKNQGFIHRVSVVRAVGYELHPLSDQTSQYKHEVFMCIVTMPTELFF